MEIFGNLPVWSVVLLSLLGALILIMLNLGWLLAAGGMLTGQRHTSTPPNDATSAGRTT